MRSIEDSAPHKARMNTRIVRLEFLAVDRNQYVEDESNVFQEK